MLNFLNAEVQTAKAWLNPSQRAELDLELSEAPMAERLAMDLKALALARAALVVECIEGHGEWDRRLAELRAVLPYASFSALECMASLVGQAIAALDRPLSDALERSRQAYAQGLGMLDAELMGEAVKRVRTRGQPIERPSSEHLIA